MTATGTEAAGSRRARGLSLRAPKLRSGGFFPEGVIERCQKVDRACVSSKGFEQNEHLKLISLSIGGAHAF